MYEVFLNERKLTVGDHSIRPNLNNRTTIVEIHTCHEIPDRIVAFLAGDDPFRAFLSDDPGLWNWFCQFFRLLPAAGGIVRSEKGTLFIFRRGKWDLPKGKIDRGETPEIAALREVTEETGLTRLNIDGHCPSTWHIYPSDYPGKPREWILKETSWFTMRAEGEEEPVPETGEDIEQVRWFTPAEISEVRANTFASLRGVIDEVTG